MPVIPRCELPTTIPALAAWQIELSQDSIGEDTRKHIYGIGIWYIELQRVASTRQPFNDQHSGCIRFFKSSPWPTAIHTATTQLVTPTDFHLSKFLRWCTCPSSASLYVQPQFIFFFSTKPVKMYAWSVARFHRARQHRIVKWIVKIKRSEQTSE